MGWVLLAALSALLVLPRLARKRREQFPVLPGEPISTMRSETSRKRSNRTKAALDAASQVLR